MEKIEVSVVKKGGVNSLLKTKRDKKKNEKETAIARKKSSLRFGSMPFMDEGQIRSDFQEWLQQNFLTSQEDLDYFKQNDEKIYED